MSNFALLVTDPAGDIISSVNYLLATQGQTNANAILGNTLTANVVSGQITTLGDPNYLAYLYQYINVRYADSADGSVNFSTSPTNRLYFGTRNSITSTASNNPVDYIWIQVVGGFSTNKFLYYKVIGGQQIRYVVDTSLPAGYAQTVDGVAIDLFNITGANGTPGTDGVNAWQANINYPSILYTMNNAGIYDSASTIVIATFSNSSAAATASIYANVDSNGSITFNNISVNPDITLSTINSNYAATTTFRHISNVSVATVVQTVPSGPPQLLTEYSSGQYFISSNDGSWQPPKQANNAVQTTANVIVTRSNTTLSSFQRVVNYFTNNGVWALTSTGTDVNIGRITFGNAITSNSSYYLPFLYSDLGGNAAGSIAVSIVSGGANGSPGAPGTRGFVPLAYIITASDPTNYSDAQYTYAFEAPRTNVAAPIGTGYIPITGDTAQFTYTNPPFPAISVFKTFNANVIPNWSNVDGQVIDGNVLVSGTITSNKLNVNDIYALNIQSTNANFGNTSSNGYWMASSNGDARFGGNVSIGANLNVQGLITSGILNANVVTGTQLAYDSVGVNQILANAVTQQKIADQAISNAKIALGTITNDLIQTNSLLGNVFANGAITAQQIAQYTIASNLLANGAVTGQQIANNAITTGLIAANAITNAVIADATITNVQIAGKTITGTLIAGETITGNLIAGNTITGSLIAQNTITGNLIAQNTITGNLVALNTITGNLIAQNTITGNLVALSTITGNLIANATITNTLIATGTITGNNIQANTITGNNIAAGTITTDKLAANAITTNTVISTNATFGSNTSPGFWLDGSTGNARFGGQLSVGSIISGSGLNANVVTSTQLAYDSVGTNQILANAVVQGKIADRAISNAKIALGTIDNQLIQVGSLLGNVFANGAVTGQQIANNAITTGLIAANAITNAVIANATITNVQIAGSTITGSLIAGSTITGNLIATNTITGNLIATNTITGSLIALSTITGNLIANLTITNNLIATGTITANQIQANTITGNQIAAATITADKLAVGTIIVANSIQSNNATFGSNTSAGFWLDANTGNARFGGQLSVGSIITNGGLNANVVTSTQLAYDSVTVNQILANAVTQQKIADRAISNAKIELGSIDNQLIQVNSLLGNVFQNGTISTQQIANNAITTGLINAGAVTGAKIANATITDVQIANKTITASLIADNTITGTLIAQNTITGNLIAGSTITGNLISLRTITESLIANSTITNNLIATGTITASLIQANAITASKIAANAVTTAQLAAGSVTADKLAANVLTVNTVISTGATLGSNTSSGFWLDGSTGNARFGGGLNVGNNLTVGNLIINSSLAANVVGYNNLQPGIVPTPAGNVFLPSSVTLTSSSQYDWAYTSGSIFGYTETLAYSKILVTPGMAANSQQTTYKVSFSATWNGTLFPAYPNSPSFYLFYNDSWYGGADQTVIIPLSGSPAPSGSRANIGSIIYPQFGYYPQGTSTGTINFSGNINMGTNMFSPFGGRNPTVNSNIVIGVAFINGNGTNGNVGTQAFTNLNFTVTT